MVVYTYGHEGARAIAQQSRQPSRRAYIVLADILMTHIVMAHIVMAMKALERLPSNQGSQADEPPVKRTAADLWRVARKAKIVAGN